MKWIFLRSAHAGEAERTRPLVGGGDCDDMWSLVFRAACEQARAQGLILRVGDDASAEHGRTVREVRTDDLAAAVSAYAPDVIIDRGGYEAYGPSHNASPDAFRVYLGCGARWNPARQQWTAGRRYDLVLVDTPEQREIAAAELPDSVVRVFHKPAAPQFVPVMDKPIPSGKAADVVYICNRPSISKGTKWLADVMPDGTSVIRIGPEDQWFRARADSGELSVWFAGQLSRAEIPAVACKARVGIVCDDGEKDSGPRIVPELLAMNLPVLLRDTVRTDAEAYITPETGRVTNEQTFAADLAELLAADVAPRAHYTAGLTIEHAAGRLAQWITRGQELRAINASR